MGCLDTTAKIAMMIDELMTINKMLSNDAIRPDVKGRLVEEKNIVKKELKLMYFDLFKIINN